MPAQYRPQRLTNLSNPAMLYLQSHLACERVIRSPQFYQHAATEFSSAAFFFVRILVRRDRQATAGKEIKVTSKPVIETDFAELPDGTLLDTIEDPSNPARTLLAVYRDQSVHYANQFEADDRICVPVSRTTEILRHVRFSRGAKPYKSTDHLLGALTAVISHCLDMSDLQRVLL